MTSEDLASLAWSDDIIANGESATQAFARRLIVAGCAALLVPSFARSAAPKIPGALGVGQQRAAQLLRRYETLDGVLAAGLFPAQTEALRLYRAIATMDASAPLPSLADQKPTRDVASELVRQWGLERLADRLDEKARSA